MDTGVNCSTISENGTFVSQFCTFCCKDTSSTSAASLVCSESACSASSPADTTDVNDISAYTFWLILAGASAFTVVVLLVSYAVCRFRRPGCADASSAQERFLVENILGAQGRTRTHAVLKSTASDATTTAPSPTSASPDLLLEAPLTKGRPQGKEAGPGSLGAVRSSAVNKAFLMGAEAFSRIPVHVNRAGQAGRMRVAGETDVSMVSPRLVHVGGVTPRVTPRVPLKEKGKTESRQTIISENEERLTAVGT